MLSWLIVGLLLFVLAGCGGQTPKQGGGTNTAAAEPYRLGAVLDISGPASSLGVPERNTLQMLADELNAKGGINGHPLELTILDTKTNETEAVLAIKKLIENEKVVAVLGASTSGSSMAMLDTAQKSGIPLVSMAAASKIVEPVDQRHWVFKTAQTDLIVANRLASYMKEKGISRVAFMYMNNAYGDGGRQAFTQAAANHGLKIVAQEKFEATDKDMTAQLIRVKGTDAQAVLVWAIPPSASIVTKNFRDLGLKLPLFQTHGVGNQNFLDLAGEAANGVVLPVGKLLVADQLPDTDPQKKLLLDYIKDYKAKFNQAPSTFGGHAWDAFNLVVNALARAGNDPAKIRDELEKTTNFVGISGVFNMSPSDHNGLDESSLVMVEVKDGKWKLIK